MEAFDIEIENRIAILNTALLLTNQNNRTLRSKHKHHIQLLGNDANE